MKMLELIRKKRDGLELTRDEIIFISKSAARGDAPDYQLSAWLMASFLRGLTERETAFLTEAMARSGKRMNFDSIPLPKVDKHSTGGVGDGISLALAPLVACAGVAVPMMSGRGLGHTGGTLDKLESIPGFKVCLSSGHVLRQLKTIGVCMFGQTSELAPADRKLYALRDATATVESRPLIVASILSKKFAENLDALVLDVKYGSGAFLVDYEESRKLAQSLVSTGARLGMRCAAVLSAMEQPLGLAIGNAFEMEQAIKVLHGDTSAKDFVELLGTLGGWMVYMAKKAASLEEGMKKLEEAIRSGAAVEKMRQMIRFQGGNPKVADYPDRYLAKARLVVEIKAGKTGYIASLDARKIGGVCAALGGGRTRMEDSIDYGAGIMLVKKAGDRVRASEVVARLYSSDSKKLVEGRKEFLSALKIGNQPVKPAPLIKEIIK